MWLADSLLFIEGGNKVAGTNVEMNTRTNVDRGTNIDIYIILIGGLKSTGGGAVGGWGMFMSTLVPATLVPLPYL